MHFHTRPFCLLAATAASLAMATSSFSNVEPHAGMLRYPDVSKDHIVFRYANDLWVVDHDGGEAKPLVSPPGTEGLPKFSDDGQTIAFVGNYDGGLDIYTIPVQGGLPYRVTHHPAGEMLSGWTPGGRLLFSARGIKGIPHDSQMFTVSPEGGMPEQIPVPNGSFGSISDDGQWLAYTPNSREDRSWKRYQGGLAADIWLFNLNTYESRKITDWAGTDAMPMWFGDSVYYMSNAGEEEKLNIWVYHVGSNSHEQITRFRNYDVKWPSIGPGDRGQGEIVFQLGTKLMLLDLRSHQTTEVSVTIPGARPKLRTQRVDASRFLFGGNISSTGVRAVLEARGDIWTVPEENGSPRNLTRSSGSAQRGPAWSPDGKWVSYYSDESGEYELYLTQSDGKGETKQLTHGNKTFFMNTFWAPDSEKIAMVDKDGKVFIHDLETEETKQIDQDPQARFPVISWSHDSQWITYSRSSDVSDLSVVWLYNVDTDEHHQLTSGMFPDTWPAFDRKGDYIYFASNRFFSPTYGDFGSSWIYGDSDVLIAVPLRDDVEAPWPLEVDEETWEEEEEEDEADEESDADEEDEAAEGDDEDAAAGDGEEEADDEAETDMHPLHGVWEGTVSGLKPMLETMIPPDAGIDIPDSAPYTLNITVDEDGNISGTSTIVMMGQSQTEELGDVTFNEDTGEFVETDEENGVKSTMRGILEGDTISGTWEVSGAMNGSGTWSVTKTDEEPEESEEEAAETVEIDIEGFESRAIMLPVDNGSFYSLAVNDKNQLLYVRGGEGIKIFDITDDDPAEKTVVDGARGFVISADGKKIAYADASGFKIGKASSGGAGKAIPTKGMIAYINPREEWKQIFTDAWRIQRDFFYAANMHGVDWDAVYEQYLPMIEDCNSRSDVSYVIGEMIGELNVGHAYYFGGDTERGGSRRNVGMLGVDFELTDEGYRITRIHEGGAWDVDARNPFTRNDIDLQVGDFILAVNDMELDTSLDPWAAFLELAGQTITVTVKDGPDHVVRFEDDDECEDEDEDENGDDDEADEEDEDSDTRDVILKPMGSEFMLRFRSWIEHNRQYVEEQTDGQVGYIYVPDTGVRGQTELFRQFVGQYDKKALIIDERWNGGGQIPDRFIELLNRPITSYFAIRDGRPSKIPTFAHTGPKCMLINGRAGSGGDMFPYLFKQAGLGKLVGTRTWGGLVGISGNPALIDGGYTSAPRFAFYELDGTWGVEGHGVDPDIEVIADPALMVDGGDPQLDAAIDLMLQEIRDNPYNPVAAPPLPDRSGIGITEEDKNMLP